MDADSEFTGSKQGAIKNRNARIKNFFSRLKNALKRFIKRMVTIWPVNLFFIGVYFIIIYLIHLSN